MKKLIYLIVAIVVFGLIVAGCIPVVPPSEQNESGSLPNKAIISVGSGESIQAAIDAAGPGDTISVGPGTYIEQITIQKSIRLIGAGETTIIKAPASRTSTVSQGSSSWDYIVAAYPTTGTIDVRIQGFTIDADNQPKTTGTAGLIGVFFRDVSGTDAGLYSCTIHGFGTTEYESWGVRVYGDSDLTIDDNTLTDYTRDGIVVNGDVKVGADPDVVISNNDLTGSSIPLNGIQIAFGATGTIIGNTVRDHIRSSPAAVGILVLNSDGITISNNTVQNSHYGIHLEGANNCIVSANTLTANIAKHIGLLSSNYNQVSGNTITGTTAGTEDCAIRFSSGSTDNNIDGNTITMATSDSWATPLLYVIYVQGDVGSGNNTIKNNIISGGKRGIQIDGGNSGTTTIANNTISNSPTGPNYPIWGVGINGGSSIISGNTLTNTVRPVDFQGAINVTISDNTIDGSTFDGINCGSASGAITISGNEIYNLPDWQFAIHGLSGADNIVIDDNEMYNSHRGIGIESGCTGVSITNNNIHDNGWSAMELHETVTTITGNRLIDNWRGIETWSPVTAHNNDILSHAHGGIILHHAGPHDATCNWWGDASGPSGPAYPGTGTFINDNGNTIDYSPWLGITITNLSGPADPVQIEAVVNVDYSFTCATSSAILYWGDGSQDSLSSNSGTATYAYSEAGVYTVTLEIQNSCESDSEEFQYVVVYDPIGGFVTGGGWIDSPAGAYTADPSLTGKATFGFVSKYKKGAAVPTGKTEFQFKAGDLNFHSESYDWLVIAGAKAMYKGTGTINGMGEYKFMLSAIDADINENDSFGVDRFRIKIWGSTGVIYDNQINDNDDADLTTEIGGGQIVIHKKK